MSADYIITTHTGSSRVTHRVWVTCSVSPQSPPLCHVSWTKLADALWAPMKQEEDLWLSSNLQHSFVCSLESRTYEVLQITSTTQLLLFLNLNLCSHCSRFDALSHSDANVPISVTLSVATFQTCLTVQLFQMTFNDLQCDMTVYWQQFDGGQEPEPGKWSADLVTVYSVNTSHMSHSNCFGPTAVYPFSNSW